MSSATRRKPKNIRPAPSRPSSACPPSPWNVAAIGFAPVPVAAGLAGAAAGAGDVAGVEETPGLDPEPLTGADAVVNGVVTVGVVLTAKPGAAVTDTREPPSEITNTFALGLLGGIQTMMSEPAV